VNATAVEDKERGIVCEAEIALFNLKQHGPPEIRAWAKGKFFEVKSFREGRWGSKCDKCHCPISSHPGKVECDRVPGAYS
jgi:hypothetical protein